MILICGLGNPGRKYKNTRHNIGFEFIDKIIDKYNFKIFKKDKDKELYKGKIKNKEYYILKPQRFMNLSGLPISNFVNYYKIPKRKLYIIHDDLDLTLGKIRIKFGGGNAGHNGLVNIDNKIGNSYHRLRIGIGHPGSKELVTKYVLEKFSSKEKAIIDEILEFSNENLELLFSNKELFLSKVNSLTKKIT